MNYIKEKLQKINKHYFVILLVSILLMSPVLYKKISWGHDYPFHVTNIFSMNETVSFKTFQFFPSKVVPIIGNNFGYGTGIFYPRMAHTVTMYLYKIFSFIKFNIPLTMEVTKLFVIFLSGVAMYTFMQKVFKNKNVSIVSSISYITAPYFLTDIYIRCAYAEIFIFLFIPLVFIGLYELLYGSKKQFYIYFTIGYIGMINSHLVMSVLFTFFILILLFINLKKVVTKENIKALLISSIFILLISSTFLVPLLEHKFFGNYIVFAENAMTNMDEFLLKSLSFADFFRNKTTIPMNGIVWHLNYALLFLFIMVVYNYKEYQKEKRTKEFLKIMLVLTALTALMATHYFPWEYMPSFMRMIQFPFRLLTFLIFSMSAVAGLSVLHYKDSVQKIIIPFFLFGLLYFGFSTIQYNNICWPNYPDNLNRRGLGAQNEYLPVNTSHHYDYYVARKDDVSVKKGKAKITNVTNKTPNLDFDIDTTGSTIELPRIYYLGYTITFENDNTKTTLNYTENKYGFIEVKVKEKGHIKVRYTGTKLDRAANVISVLSIVVAIYLLVRKKKGKPNLVKEKKK